jgi:16S rRNA (cytosine1402-N4)-methyltransferase
LNGGGHTKEILKRIKPHGKVLGIELDGDIYKNIKRQKISGLIAINDSYVHLKKIIEQNNFENIAGILFDLGMSSWHIDESGKGFSFKTDEPLLMSYSTEENEKSAEKIVNNYSEENLERIIREYGEEKFSRRIVKKIVEARRMRPIKTTLQLVEIIRQGTPAQYHHQRLHFATRTFQALRIETNDELNNIQTALPQAWEALKPEGKLVVISFHSLEDRIIKNYFREKAKNGEGELLTKKPITSTEEEIEINPRTKSSKLRAIKKYG